MKRQFLKCLRNKTCFKSKLDDIFGVSQTGAESGARPGNGDIVVNLGIFLICKMHTTVLNLNKI